MNADTAVLILLVVAWIPATFFPILYSRVRWWSTLPGRALFVQGVGMGLLINISLAYRVLGEDYAGRDVARLAVFGLVAAGLWAIYFAQILEQRRGNRNNR